MKLSVSSNQIFFHKFLKVTFFDRENDLLSNRGNNLLIKLLQNRYPYVYGDRQIEVLKQYLSVTSVPQGLHILNQNFIVIKVFFSDAILQKYGVNERICYSLIQSYISEYSKSYPMKIGEEFSEKDKNQMALFLVYCCIEVFHKLT